MYLDANNLYGWAMSQPLPTGRFKWLKGDKWDDIFKHKEGIRYFIECDLEYPKELHYLHTDYPLAPEKLIVQDDWLSPFSKNLKENFGLASDKTTKLIPTLFNKEKYVLHIRNLSLYKDLGMKLTKVHRVLQFDESPWLAKYINFNTETRKEAKTVFEKDYFKLMNNAVFGKTLENLRKRINLKLTSNEDISTKHAARANFISGKMFNENLFAINKMKEELVLNRPNYVGMAILDLSKPLMYDFHYNYMS